MNNNYLWFLLLFFFSINSAFTQQKFEGRVYDKNNKEPLAFVNIIYNSKNLGTTTDLNGYFKINNKDNIEFLRISYLGYSTKTYEKQNIINKSYIQIFLEEDIYRLDEVLVFPGENPAHRIIKEVKRNADKNNPVKMTSFSYMAYSRMHFTVDTDDLKIKDKTQQDSTPTDTVKSTIERVKEFFDTKHIFLTESITERRFRYPDNNKEEVLAHRISGLQKPSFALLTSQFQSFSFYNEFINIFDKRYTSPISRGSTRRYFFHIEDTMYNERADTIFVISFRPSRGRNFDGLQGVLHINSNNYAIQNVSAKPYESSGIIDISIQQMYDLIDEKQWFPVQLNTEITFNVLQATADTINMPIIGIGRSYLSEISLDPDFKRRDFNHIQVEINESAHKKDESFWNLFRTYELSQKDLRTYEFIDSIGEEINIDRMIEFIEIIATGNIPFGFVNINLHNLMWYNEYEGMRLGMGLNTNHRLLTWMSLGAYFAYGFRDKAWKFGGETEFFIHKPSDTRIRFGYRQDLKYSNSYFFNKRINIFSQNNDNIKHLFHSQMDSVTEYYTGLRFSTFRYLSADILLKRSEVNITNLYRYEYDNKYLTDIYEYYPHFYNTELGIYLRYAYKEKFLQTPKGNRLSLGTNYPILYFNFIKGLSLFDGQHIYQKYETQIYKRIITRWFGETYITITGGLAEGNVPYSDFYYEGGTYSFLSVNNTFNTMRPHEFISERFANIHIRHDFGSLLFKTKKWKPRFVLTSSAGWGDAKNLNLNIPNINPESKKMNKGFFESGLQINNITLSNYSGVGIAVYYRYGAYAMPKEIDNFAFKLSLSFVY